MKEAEKMFYKKGILGSSKEGRKKVSKKRRSNEIQEVQDVTIQRKKKKSKETSKIVDNALMKEILSVN